MGWQCPHCTYHHQYNATRCAMCGGLRDNVSQQEMMDFVATGKRPALPAATVASPAAANKKKVPQKQSKLLLSPSVSQAADQNKNNASQQQSTLHLPKAAPNSDNDMPPSPLALAAAATTTTSLSHHQQQTRAPAPPAPRPPTATVVRNPYATSVNVRRTTSATAAPRTALPAAQQQRIAPPTTALQLQRGGQSNIMFSKAAATAGNTLPAPSAGTRPPQQPPPPWTKQQPPQQQHHGSSRQRQGLIDARSMTVRPPAKSHERKPAPSSHHQASSHNGASQPSGVYQPGPVPLSPETAGTWIYPACQGGFARRDYQVEISETAIFHNTLVSLPTGLGKTLIAAVVLYNYYRWFPEGKVLFLAPTLPLVNQQVKACHSIMGISERDTAVLTGKTSGDQRQHLWSEKRVFFCTPQTVENDLQSQRINADLVVCVVLDEAHKAVGEYAYKRVMDLLSNSRAKFRVLGLSATPGTSIKAIQVVVDNLRISKVEARSEDDASVAPYLHERVSEVVVVPQMAATKEIETRLCDMLTPLLDRLRSARVFHHSGNATLTTFNMLKAREGYEKRLREQPQTTPPGLVGFFLAAFKLVELRGALHREGVGVVRTKMMRLRNEPQRGLLSTIVKSPEFAALWNEIILLTGDPDQENEQPGLNAVRQKESLIRNNPKLLRLREILREHFERAKACGTSSRSIVFSQFRDSVSEIVSVLELSQPLIRPRHFVGQSKGSGNGSSNKGAGKTANGSSTEAVAPLKGMKQAEQQEAIRQFRENVFNVLVCTCIGEEGLDIGEVDLIVNFDSLRSPIRMIQRTGRTGRKRDGRVICLIAEGPEEQTYRNSKSSERTLQHALKNPRSFKVIPTEPLFPHAPVMQEQAMHISQNFHMSQVEGLRSSRLMNGPSTKSVSAQSLQWRLSATEEERRAIILGLPEQVPSFGCSLSVFPLSLRRRLFAARIHSRSRISKKGKLHSLGRTVKILRSVENTKSTSTALPRDAVKPLRSRGSTLDALFPLESNASSEYAFAPKKNRRSSFSTRGSFSNGVCPQENPASTVQNVGELQPTQSMMQNVEDSCRQLQPSALNHVAQPTARATDCQEKPYADTVVGSVSHHAASRTLDLYPQNVQPSVSPVPEEATASKVRHLGNEGGAPGDDEFVLPSPADSSSDEDEPGENDEPKEMPKAPASSVKTPASSVTVIREPSPRPHGPIRNSGALELNEDAPEDSFCLPSQDSSSSEEESEAEDARGQQADMNISAVEAPMEKSEEASAVPYRPIREQVAKPSSRSGALSAEVLESVQTSSLASRESETGPAGSVRLYNESPNGGLVHQRKTAASASSSAPMTDNATGTTKVNCQTFGGLPDGSIPPGSNPDTFCNASTTENRAQSGLSSGSQPTKATEAAVKPSAWSQRSENNARERHVCFGGVQTDGDESPHFPLPARRKRPHRRVRAIDDTPESVVSSAATQRRENPLSPPLANQLVDTQPEDDSLMDTQDVDIDSQQKSSAGAPDADDIVCAVCFSGESTDEDPIILCDGPGRGLECSVAVHVSCYAANVNLDSDSDWRCDQCEYRFSGRRSELRCAVCGGVDGLLKKFSDSNEWRHVACECEKKGLTKLGQETSSVSAQPLVDSSARNKRRKFYRRHFFDEEADVSTDEDVDGDVGEETDLQAVEEREALESSFINDSSQMGYTQDELDRVDPSSNVHRAVDTEREQIQAMKTPVLNRRMQRAYFSQTQDGGLGNMHFIRSVLEHTRNGGRAADIEEVYNQMEEEE